MPDANATLLQIQISTPDQGEPVTVRYDYVRKNNPSLVLHQTFELGDLSVDLNEQFVSSFPELTDIVLE